MKIMFVFGLILVCLFVCFTKHNKFVMIIFQANFQPKVILP